MQLVHSRYDVLLMCLLYVCLRALKNITVAPNGGDISAAALERSVNQLIVLHILLLALATICTIPRQALSLDWTRWHQRSCARS